MSRSRGVAHPTDRAGRAVAVTAVVEAVTWAGLLVGMVLKHVTRSTELGVEIFGPLHGAAFLAYVAAALVAAARLRWRWWVLLLALAAAVPPLTTIAAEVWLRRTGRLAPSIRSRSRTASGPATPAG